MSGAMLDKVSLMLQNFFFRQRKLNPAILGYSIILETLFHYTILLLMRSNPI